MIGFLSKIFQANEIKNVRRELESLLTTHAPLSSVTILPAALALLHRKKSEIVSDIRDQSMNSRDAACIVASSTIMVQLGSGQHHVYRGVLSTIGSDMLQAFNACIASLKSSGFYSEEQARNSTELVQQKIKSVG